MYLRKPTHFPWAGCDTDSPKVKELKDDQEIYLYSLQEINNLSLLLSKATKLLILEKKINPFTD